MRPSFPSGCSCIGGGGGAQAEIKSFGSPDLARFPFHQSAGSLLPAEFDLADLRAMRRSARVDKSAPFALSPTILVGLLVRYGFAPALLSLVPLAG